MGLLRRSPQDLRNYILWYSRVGKQYGSVTEFVRRERLNWEVPVFAKDPTTLFGHPEDFKIIRNDWPYGLEEGLTHLVVWSKNRISTDATTGLPSADATAAIEKFLSRTFEYELGARVGENILWFKQKTEWQSVRSLEHIHVILRDVADDAIDSLVGMTRQQTLCNLAREGLDRFILMAKIS